MSESEHTPQPYWAIASVRGPSPQLWTARLRRFLFVGSPLALLVILTWSPLPASKLPVEPYKSQARATHGDYDPPQAAVVPAVVQALLQASTPFAKALSQVARQKGEHRPVVMTYGSTALPAYMKPRTRRRPRRRRMVALPTARQRSRAARLSRSRTAISCLCLARSPASWTR